MYFQVLIEREYSNILLISAAYRFFEAVAVSTNLELDLFYAWNSHWEYRPSLYFVINW